MKARKAIALAAGVAVLSLSPSAAEASPQWQRIPAYLRPVIAEEIGHSTAYVRKHCRISFGDTAYIRCKGKVVLSS